MAQSIMAKTSADKTGIGFDYQYYFFLWKIPSVKAINSFSRLSNYEEKVLILDDSTLPKRGKHIDRLLRN